ncbi:hypothetical protein [Azotosporobacter soli]|uniref:hypothetical protein n=1 Tax=Azotosporobacter soli TaxID=3055040 RepID=UPI0031FECD45
MEKLELLASIRKLSSVVHCDNLAQALPEESMLEMRATLDQLSEKYVSIYC